MPTPIEYNGSLPQEDGREDEHEAHLCDACGVPIVGEHFTDEVVCRGGDGPGFFLCGMEACVANRPGGIRQRRAFYTRQRERNEQRHGHTAESVLSFHVEMGGESVDEDFRLGDLLNMTTDELAALTKDELEETIRSAHDDWTSNHVSSGWEIE